MQPFDEGNLITPIIIGNMLVFVVGSLFRVQYLLCWSYVPCREHGSNYT